LSGKGDAYTAGYTPALVTEPARSALAFIADAFADNYGTGLGIAGEDDISGPTTAVGGLAFTDGTVFTQDINVRYAITTDVASLRKRLDARINEHGFAVTHWHDSAPTYTPKDHPAVAALDATVAEFYGGQFTPYVMGGGTYARKIPNAVGLGNGARPKIAGMGGGHQPNEGVCIDDLLIAIRIYVLALLRLDKVISL
jgi:succinyl-diaminopimelate desuccinylase